MQEIKIGDIVRFSVKKTIPAKTGEVVQINGDKANVFVMNETKVYEILLIKLKKILKKLEKHFIFVSIIMKDNYDNYTVALGLYQMLTRENIYQYFTRFCAGAVLVAIPITLLFIKMQKYYVGGVTGGSVKG